MGKKSDRRDQRVRSAQQRDAFLHLFGELTNYIENVSTKVESHSDLITASLLLLQSHVYCPKLIQAVNAQRDGAFSLEEEIRDENPGFGFFLPEEEERRVLLKQYGLVVQLLGNMVESKGLEKFGFSCGIAVTGILMLCLMPHTSRDIEATVKSLSEMFKHYVSCKERLDFESIYQKYSQEGLKVGG